ncbi:TonB-dependent siderophore receptor [Sphingosinicella xenopeptidilytica]|uniref:TonB-dependent siderophore receptor n=1 Tax=Sphingosinicella xenopeptidilytica TaxID=364098 RepID=A0ABW3C1K4_SPHXN
MTVHDRTLKTLLLAGAALTGFTTLPAMAQEAAPTGASLETTRTTVGGEEMIVVTARNYVPEGSATASKTDIPLIETPQSISVVTRDQIDLLNFIDAQQAVRYTAGVFGENYGPDLRFDFFTVRGFTPKQYIDGLAAPISTSIYSVGVDLYAFESLDLLKGPASVLYGNAPPGGIYNQVSRRAQSALGGEISAKYGEDDYKQLAATVTGPVSSSLDARFTLLYRDRDAERDHVSAKRLTAAPTFTWRLGESTSLTGLGYYQYDEVRGDTNGFLPVYGTLLDNPIGKVKRSVNLGDPNNLYERRQFALGWDFRHEFSESLKFSSNTKWSEYKERTPTGIYGGGGLVNTTDPLDPSYYRTVQQYNFSYAEDVKSFATDNRIDVNFATGGVEHKLLVGADYRNVYNKADFGFIFANTIDLFDPVYAPQLDYTPGYAFSFNNQRLKQTGIYAQDQVQFGNLYVTAGGRYDWVKVKAIATGAETKQDKFTYRLGVNYVAENGIAPYLSYATSFEPTIGTNDQGDPYDPTTGRQIEGGVKYDARGLGDDIKLFVTAAAFQIKQKNLVSSQVGSTGAPIGNVQSGEVEVYGGEVEIVSRIREQLSINGSYSYNHSEVKKSLFGDAGAVLPTTPKHKLSLFVDYTIQQGSLGGLGFGIGGRYTSKSAGGLPSGGPVFLGESATLFDAIVHYDTPEWRFAINGSNIFDKVYVARCASVSGCTYGAGRQVIGTVTRKF